MIDPLDIAKSVQYQPRELESAGQEEVLGELHRVRLLPLVLHVRRRPTV